MQLLSLFTCPLCGQMRPFQCPGFGRHSPASTIVRNGDSAQCSQCGVHLTQVTCSVCSQVISLTPEILDDPQGTKQTTHEQAMQQMMQFSEINKRFVKAVSKASSSLGDKRVITELEEILADYNRFFKGLAPRYPACNPRIVEYKIADTTSWIGYAYESLRNNQEAVRYLEQAALQFGKIGEAEEVKKCEEKIRKLQLLDQGTFDNSLSGIQARRASFPKYSLQHAQATIELSNVYIGSDDYFEAEKLLIDAEKELDQIENSDAGGSVVPTLPGAAPLILLLQSIETKVQKYGFYFLLYCNLVLVYRDINFVKATECFDKAKQKNAEMTVYLQHCKEQMNLSDDSMKPFEHISNAHADLIVLLNIQQEFNVLRRDIENFIEQVSQQHQNTGADNLFQKARALELKSRQLGMPEGITTALIHQADILMAVEHYDEAIVTLYNARDALNNHWQHDRGIKIQVKLAEIYAHKQQWQKVSLLCEDGIQLVEEYRYKVTSQYMQSSYLTSRIGLYAWGARSAYELRDYKLMLERAELSKCRSVLRYRQRTLVSTTDQQSIEQEFRYVCAQIDAASTDNVLLEELRFKRRTLWDLLLIQRFQARTGKSLPQFSLEAVKSTLAADEAILYYYWLDKYTLLIAIIDQERVIPVLRSLSSKDQANLEKVADFVLKSKRESSVSYLDRSVPAFSTLLLPEEARPLLKAKKRLLISPHRILHTIPFHALQWDDAFLIQNFAVTYIPNLNSLMDAYAPSNAQHVLAVGVSEYQVPGYTLTVLKQTEQGVDSLKKLCEANSIPIMSLKGPEVQGNRFRQLDEEGQLEKFTCLHFATHGDNIESDTPMESYLFLQDEKLDGMEIANWQLRADMVVLSACSAGQRPIEGRGMKELPGDELFGLQSAFFMAGTKRILSCLWPVQADIAFPVIMDFYRQFIAGELPEFALQNSIKRFIESTDTREIYHWAPFFLSAMGRPTSPNK